MFHTKMLQQDLGYHIPVPPMPGPMGRIPPTPTQTLNSQLEGSSSALLGGTLGQGLGFPIAGSTFDLTFSLKHYSLGAAALCGGEHGLARLIDAIPWKCWVCSASLVNKDPPCPQNFSTAKPGRAICSSLGATLCHAPVSTPAAPKGLSGLGKAEPLEDIPGSQWLCLAWN